MIDTVLSDLFFNYGPAERAYIVIDGRSDDLGNDTRLYAAAAALVAIVEAFREPHYGDREQQADSVFDAMERTGALALVEKLKGIL